MAEKFPGAVLVFDSCNRKGADLMRKTWLKDAGITDVEAYFSLEDPDELKGWSEDFESVTSRSYMSGYRDLRKKVRMLYRILIRFCDSFVKMRIVRIVFGK